VVDDHGFGDMAGLAESVGIAAFVFGGIAKQLVGGAGHLIALVATPIGKLDFPIFAKMRWTEGERACCPAEILRERCGAHESELVAAA
jgi:hypothetical protein